MSCERLENDPSLPQRTTLSVDEIYSLLNLCQEATYLMFNGQVYQQVHGMAIGSPVSVVVAKNGYPATFVQRLRLPQTDQDERHTARTSVTIPYIRGLSQSIRRVLSYLDIRVAFRPFWTLSRSWSTPKTLFQNCGEREWSTPSLVTSALGVTSGRLDGLWSSALGSIIEH